jgi:hypothetical protein
MFGAVLLDKCALVLGFVYVITFERRFDLAAAEQLLVLLISELAGCEVLGSRAELGVDEVRVGG